MAQAAERLAAAIAEKLGVVGLLAVEMFVTKTGEVLVNELAPRPHNSGHLTIAACETSQFEQQVRRPKQIQRHQQDVNHLHVLSQEEPDPGLADR